MESYVIRDLSFRYPDRDRRALANISLDIGQGQFLTVCGPSGGGKTTLLRLLKPILAPHGEKSGEILFGGEPIATLDQRAQSEKIGFVLQNVENQIVTDKVWHELAFGLESLGYSTSEIRLKVAEMAAFFGIETWFYNNVAELSGGQKQLLNLASIMAMQPSVLILDEPTSQLDPIAAADFLATVGKINRELGVTVIMTEHRLEEVFPLSDRVVCLDGGGLICDDEPRRAGEILRGIGHGMFLAMPTPMRVWAGVPDPGAGACPITVRDGRAWLDGLLDCGAARLNPEAIAPDAPPPAGGGIPAIEMSGVWFRYEKESPDVVKRLSLTVQKGEFLCVVGGNGAGKTTALSLMAGLNKQQRGKVKLFGEDVWDIPPSRLFNDGGDGGLLGVLPQNPQALFVKNTLRDDLMEIFLGRKLSKEDKERRLRQVSQLCRIEELLGVHPYDLSGGEQQRAALAKILLLHPRVLLLDEPTKGLDAQFKRVFAEILKNLSAEGVSIVMVSHDIEFCAEYADRCAMFFDGSVVSDAPPREFFAGNSFYTTAANRMARHCLPRAITAADVILALGGDSPDFGRGKPEAAQTPEDSELPDDDSLNMTPPYTALHADNKSAGAPAPRDISENQRAFPSTEPAPGQTREPSQGPARGLRKLPARRKLAAAVITALLIVTLALIIANFSGFKAFISGGDDAAQAIKDPGVWRYAAMLIALCAEGLALAIALSPADVPGRLGRPGDNGRLSRGKLPARTLAATAMILLVAPLTIFIGVRYLGDRKYYFISILIILETMLPFAFVFEGRKPQARELVIIAVLCALGVAGRTAFFMLPHVKPVAALAIITGIAFGGETGFLFGSITGFLSNMFFGQGAWTPWQMFSYGIIGFLAGVMFKKGLLARSRLALCAYGGLAAFIIYGGLMNASSVLMYQAKPTLEMFLAYMVQGIPLDLIHAASTVMFLGILARPMLEKLDRIKIKYGLLE